jgi:hypothetical protein
MTSAVLCRGSVVTVASPGVYSGKPRPAVVVQTSVGHVVGQLEPQVLVELDLALRGWLELP